MALGRAERHFDEHGTPVNICDSSGIVRRHPAWEKNPAVVYGGGKSLIDGPGARPYHISFDGRRAIFNMDHRPRAGRIIVSPEARARNILKPPYAILEPNIKEAASPNKDWGFERWCEVIKDFPIPVYQLMHKEPRNLAPGAIGYHTPTIEDAMAAISGAAVVLCNEGGTHHMAASARVPAVVVFGAFVPPLVTGYEFHYNIAVETDEGYCGRWEPCQHCRDAMESITPAQVREKAILIMESYDAD